MHDAIRGLYRNDPLCDRQQQTLQPRVVEARAAEPPVWLAAETARLELLEQQLRSQTA
jgi:hypothetical protein